MKEDRQMSEHELRFQQSLQRLNVPEWYKKSQQQRKQSADSGLITRPRRAMDRVLPGGWEETKTSSMSSLQYGSSRDNVMSPDSTTSSPVPSERGGGGGSSTGGGGAYQPFRWGVGRLSGSASPCSQFSIGAASFSGRTLLSSAASTTAAAPARRPYLGWRSQEKLGKLEAAEQHLHNNRQIPPAPPAYLSPAERMAKELLAAQRQKQEEAKVQANGLTLSPSEVPHLSPRMVRNSIKEVTNAIVHYCSESDDDHFTPPRRTLNAVSPDEETPVTVVRHQRRPPTAAPKPGVWVESSFVGEKPIQSPRTPPVGDVATLLEAELLNGSDDLGSPSSLSSYDVKLVPIEKLRTGSAQLDTFFGKRELRRPTVGNGELWLQ
ncbi:unnamed protein product [Notodromas monacha]|uniref:Uncharacterized protein n=1 Tax=Notodromas monacha TaxID=399045 RepID=A0A7R9BDZ5_9CRUS|nr:unnamed protein product [Notodromas monacha]CAG0912910.1 unnamed protein product [Notodromas monacha]